MIRILSASATKEFFVRHPDFTANNVPSYGVRVTDDFEGSTKDYLVAVNHNTKALYVIDLTATNADGTRIDPAITGKSTIGLYFDAIISGIADVPDTLGNWAQKGANALNPFIPGSIMNLLALGALIFWLFQSGKAKTILKSVTK